MIILTLLIGLYFGIGIGMAIVAIEDNYDEVRDLHPLISTAMLALIGVPAYLFIKAIEWKNRRIK